MRVEVASVAKKKGGESSLAQIAGITVLFGLGYIASTPAIAELMPVPVERALTNIRKDIDSIADAAVMSADQSYRNFTALISGR